MAVRAERMQAEAALRNIRGSEIRDLRHIKLFEVRLGEIRQSKNEAGNIVLRRLLNVKFRADNGVGAFETQVEMEAGATADYGILGELWCCLSVGLKQGLMDFEAYVKEKLGERAEQYAREDAGKKDPEKRPNPLKIELGKGANAKKLAGLIDSEKGGQ